MGKVRKDDKKTGNGKEKKKRKKGRGRNSGRKNRGIGVKPVMGKRYETSVRHEK